MKHLLLTMFATLSMLLISPAYASDIDEISAHADEIRAAQKFKESISYQDPYEDFNRSMFDFNLAFHDTVGRPMVNVYKEVPSPLRTGVSNFFDNLGEPLSFTNSFLQGNVEDGLEGFMRFVINSTFGIFGLLDVATEAGLRSKDEDFGQTLQVWGFWQETNYLVLPVLGPTTTRGLVGDRTDALYDPVYNEWTDLDTQQTLRWKAADGFNTYYKVADLVDEMEKQVDPYLFARDSYIQYRNNKVYNGQAPLKPLDDFIFE